MPKTLTQGILRDRLRYDPETGVFTRLVAAGRGRIGPNAGTLLDTGYICVGVNCERYLAHRLAWFYVHGYWPKEIDHINRNPADNRLCNLREVTRSQNNRNAPANIKSKTGERGVHFHPGAGRYRAQITKDRKTTSLGYFDTIEEAAAAYKRKAQTT